MYAVVFYLKNTRPYIGNRILNFYENVPLRKTIFLNTRNTKLSHMILS